MGLKLGQIWLLVSLWTALTTQFSAPKDSQTAKTYFQHSRGSRVNTDALIYEQLSKQHAGSGITVLPLGNANLLAYAASGAAEAVPLIKDGFPLDSFSWRYYLAPAARLNGDVGGLTEIIKFAVYTYYWQNKDFLVYVVDGRDGMEPYPQIENQYIVSNSQSDVDELIMAAGLYNHSLHDEVWVFDQGYWQKNSELWRAIQTSQWSDVILDEGMKTSIQDDVSRFFTSRDQYTRYRVPWKRGLIFHGPPGNGKTISIKAIMHTLYNSSSPIPTLYVKTLKSFAGDEYSIGMVFGRARAEAPCLLVFEDLDSLVTPAARSYFLNQVDGLQANDGILMIGSTNHLDLLDPGISKRPSRFDRKYLFPDPNLEQREMYCEYWRGKLSDNPEIEFPKVLVDAIANITDGFSFAYLQEAFIASLLLIARDLDIELEAPESFSGIHVGDDSLNKFKLWRVIKHQVSVLRKELEAKTEADLFDLEYRRLSMQCEDRPSDRFYSPGAQLEQLEVQGLMDDVGGPYLQSDMLGHAQRVIKPVKKHEAEAK